MTPNASKAVFCLSVCLAFLQVHGNVKIKKALRGTIIVCRCAAADVQAAAQTGLRLLVILVLINKERSVWVTVE